MHEVFELFLCLVLTFTIAIDCTYIRFHLFTSGITLLSTLKKLSLVYLKRFGFGLNFIGDIYLGFVLTVLIIYTFVNHCCIGRLSLGPRKMLTSYNILALFQFASFTCGMLYPTENGVFLSCCLLSLLSYVIEGGAKIGKTS